MADIITLGELLIDLTQSGSDKNGNGIYTAYPGGAPANVAVAAARLGAETAFIGKIGRDAFGNVLRETLEKEGVDTSGLYETDEVPTTLAIASIDESGERSFSFYRSPGADTQLDADEAVGSLDSQFYEAVSTEDPSEITQDDLVPLEPGKCPLILHAGSLSMTAEPSREACEEALRYAKQKGMYVSFDPNYREALWESREQAVSMMKRLLPFTDILKVSEEEMEMLSGTDDLAEGSRILSELGKGEFKRNGIFLVLVTMGADGTFVRCRDFTTSVPGFRVKVADTNGAGDSFLGAMLARLASDMRSSESGRTLKLNSRKLTGMVRYANKAASITCSRSGAIPAMPSLKEMNE